MSVTSSSIFPSLAVFFGVLSSSFHYVAFGFSEFYVVFLGSMVCYVQQFFVVLPGMLISIRYRPIRPVLELSNMQRTVVC